MWDGDLDASTAIAGDLWTGRQGLASLTVEYVFGVAGPDFVVSLLVSEGASPGGVASHHVEASFG